MQLFEKAADYQAFEQVLQDTLDQSPVRICAYVVMPSRSGRVDLGGCPPKSPTDPGLHITRTRFLIS